MIRELCIAALLLPGLAWAQAEGPAAEPGATEPGATEPVATEPGGDVPAAPPPEMTDERLMDQTIQAHRSTFDTLIERSIGSASRPVRYDWRRGSFQLAAVGGIPAELNNFDSLRTGLLGRFPVGGVILGVGTSYVFVSGSRSSEQLALTPYVQPGRPERFELDLTLDYPLAEGIVTAFSNFVPASQLVLSGHLDLRYLYYPGSFSNLGFLDTAKALLAGSLSDEEADNIAGDRLPGMELDRARYAFLAGLSTDLYFQSGVFFSSKALVATPLLSFLADSELLFGFEWDIALGYAF